MGDTEVEWSKEAKRIVRAEMARRGASHRDLAAALKARGVQGLSEKSLRTKIARGTFSAGFFLELLSALGAHRIELRPPAPDFGGPHDETPAPATDRR